MPLISAKAEVCRPQALGRDVRVGPFSYVGPEVTVGAGTVIGNNVTLTGRTSVGARCQLFPTCVVGAVQAPRRDYRALGLQSKCWIVNTAFGGR